jgi:diacylglycerol kinase family enzyme
VVSLLREHYPELVLCPTQRPEHATELATAAVAAGADQVWVMGGDGTVNEVLNGMVGSSVPLGVLPAGTANVLACEVGLPRNPLKAARRLGQMVGRRIAVGRISFSRGASRHFLLMAGAGLDAAVLTRVSTKIKNTLGKLAYWVAGFRTLGKPLHALRVNIGGQQRETLFALAARVRNYGGDLAIAASASLLDPEFEVVTFAGKSTWVYPFYLGGALLGKATSLPGVESVRARHLSLASSNGSTILTQVDGELAGALPATVEIVPDAITLLVPADFAARHG